MTIIITKHFYQLRSFLAIFRWFFCYFGHFRLSVTPAEYVWWLIFYTTLVTISDQYKAFLVTSYYIQPFLVIFQPFFWLFLAIFGHLWPLLVTMTTSSTSDDHFFPLLSISGLFRAFPATFNHIQPFLSIFGHFLVFLAIFSHLWPILTTTNQLMHFWWPFLATPDYFRPFQSISSHLQPHSVISGHFQLFLAIFGNLWPTPTSTKHF